MTAGEGSAVQTEWLSYVQHIAEATEMPVEEVKPDVPLLRGLGLDSLGLAELVLALRESYEAASERQLDLAGRNWETITVGQLFSDLTGSRPPFRA